MFHQNLLGVLGPGVGVELEFPGGDSNGARPLLMIANASSASSTNFFDEFYTKSGGECGSYPGQGQ